MNTRAKAYVVFAVVGAILCSAAVYSLGAVAENHLSTIVVLSTLALIAEALAVLHPNSVIGSVGFIPYLAAALIVPGRLALAAGIIVKIIVEMISARPPLVRTFNVAQQAITFSIAVLVFTLLGGQSMADYAHLPLVALTVKTGLPALGAFVTSFIVNNTLVLGFVAAKSNQSLNEMFRASYLSIVGLDLLASPIVFLFAWVYVGFGPYAACAIWIPVLGLRQLHKNTIDLERTNSELLELMVKSMEARDPYTSGHSRRVQQYSVAIAKGLGLPPLEIDKVSRAALLHDVGKIHERYAPILRKAGKLSPEEWQTMQQHPADGAELVATMSRLRDIVPAIKHHHERWDGTGYPEGLAGETIPRISRIIAFADTIDAMTSARPYRGTLSEQEVRAEIVRCRGAQFDPAMADKILSAPIWRQLFASIAGSQDTAKTPLSLVMRERKTAGSA
jgi:putative nucleotidyltransferase with HDIG domain